MPQLRFFPILLLMFVGSGCAALIYEVVWFQLLQLVIGSSAVSLAVLLGTFMGGMGLGALLLPRLVAADRHPLRVYAWLEVGMAVCGLAVLVAVPLVGHAYVALAGAGPLGIALRALVCVLCLLPPTILMGATLPAIARWVEATPRGVAWLGFFYGGNTLGAVAGCLLAGFWLLRVHDTTIATFVAVGINAAVAVGALVLARTEPHAAPTAAESPEAETANDTQSRPVLLAIAISGFCALAAEVIWTRVLSLLLGATVYTFALILAVFLAGLALGGSGGAALARATPRPRFWLAVCQLLQVAAITWAAYATLRLLPAWEVDHTAALATKFRFDLLRVGFAVLPSALLWGASFPLALAALAIGRRDPARLVGRACAANTLGAIGGAVLTGLVLVPLIGAQHAQVAIAAAAVLAAGCALWPIGRRELGLTLAGAGAFAAAVLLIPPLPWQLVAYGRQVATTDYGARAIYLGEGVNATVAVTETPGGARFFHVSGKTEASSLQKDMRLQLMLGHIPALLHPHPKSVLIVGCGAGVTAGTFVLHPSIERIVICDIEPLIPRVVAAHFSLENHAVLHDRRVEIVHDDARHYMATTREKFDIITSDPIHPWVKGSAVLYSQEYFALCRARLKPGGLVTQWVPLYESDRAVVQSEIATFFSVFPHGSIWGNDDDGSGYDTVLLGPTEPAVIDLEALQARILRPEYARVQRVLTQLGLGTALDLLSTYAGNLPDLRAWLHGAEINRDRTLRLQYLAGLQLESGAGAAAYREILALRKFPADTIRAPDPDLIALRRRLDEAAGVP
ncbi:MAG: fused MFS/spermidine synthase [Opitutaceae bacterium]|nr:fused MFS/spermidine synthase [Opitutaceae bacterium]